MQPSVWGKKVDGLRVRENEDGRGGDIIMAAFYYLLVSIRERLLSMALAPTLAAGGRGKGVAGSTACKNPFLPLQQQEWRPRVAAAKTLLSCRKGKDREGEANAAEELSFFSRRKGLRKKRDLVTKNLELLFMYRYTIVPSEEHYYLAFFGLFDKDVIFLTLANATPRPTVGGRRGGKGSGSRQQDEET